MGKNDEASLFQRFVIMLFGLGVVLVGAYPLTKNHGGIKKYIEKKFNEGKELNLKELSFKDITGNIFSGTKGSEYSGSKSSNKVASKSESSRAIFWGFPKSDEEESRTATKREIEKKQRINKAEDHLTKSDRDELNSLLDTVPE